MNNTNFVELRPTDSHKSFYGKATVGIAADGAATLYSYGTPILRKNADGSLSKLWYGYSATTMRHINSFADTFGIALHGKKEWEAL